MAWPTTFGTLAAGDQNASLFDTMFNAVGLLATVPCTASGTNTIALTPTGNCATQTAYANYQVYGFVAANTSTGSITVNVAALGALPLYLGNGSSQAGSGAINAGSFYAIVYNSALNSGSGGFQILAPYIPGATATPPNDPNVLRNSGLTDWFSGTSGTVPTTAGVTSWTAEGVFSVATGATLPWAQQASDLTSPLSFYSVKFTGATGNTDLKVRFVVESYTAIRLAGQTVTFQIPVYNNTGGALVATLATAYPSAQDNWGTTTTDLSATNLQSIANGSSGTLAYTLSVSANAKNGYEFIVDFGVLSANTKTIEIGGGFDARPTPGVAIGLNSSPPTPFIADPASAKVWNSRFYQTDYPNGTAPGSASNFFTNGTGSLTPTGGGVAAVGVAFPVQMRAAPTVSYWDGAGNASRESTLPVTTAPGGTWTANVTPISGPTSITAMGFMWTGNNDGSTIGFIHYAADARIAGG